MSKKTVGVIGLGHVGAHVAFTLGMLGIADHVRLCDKNEQKAVSECQDLMDAVMFMPHRVIYTVSSYEELSDCDIIVNAVGKIDLLKTLNRDSELEFTVAQVNDIIPKVMAGGFHGIFVNITNPCDVVTNRISELSGLPKGHVLGTGTGLDTSRLVNVLSQQTDIAPASIHAYMLGEHGNAQMTPWSNVSFGGKALADCHEEKFQFDRAEMTQRAIRGGWVTYVGKGCTEYGICSAAARLVRAIFHDTKEIIPCSCELSGEYGVKGVFTGCPAVIGADGAEKPVELRLTEEELDEFRRCCDTIKANYQKALKI